MNGGRCHQRLQRPQFTLNEPCQQEKDTPLRQPSIANYARPERIGEIIIIVNPLFTPWALGRVVNAPDVTDDEDVDPDFLTAVMQ